MIREFMPILNKNACILLMGYYAGQQAYSSSLAYAVLINSYMNGAIIDIHGGYDYF